MSVYCELLSLGAAALCGWRKEGRKKRGASISLVHFARYTEKTRDISEHSHLSSRRTQIPEKKKQPSSYFNLSYTPRTSFSWRLTLVICKNTGLKQSGLYEIMNSYPTRQSFVRVNAVCDSPNRALLLLALRMLQHSPLLELRYYRPGAD